MVFDTISHGYLSVGKDYHMNEYDQKHLTLSNRTYIEQELLQKSTFSSIGSVLHKDPSTISKEVKRYSKTIPAGYSYKCNLCKHSKRNGGLFPQVSTATNVISASIIKTVT